MVAMLGCNRDSGSTSSTGGDTGGDDGFLCISDNTDCVDCGVTLSTCNCEIGGNFEPSGWVACANDPVSNSTCRNECIAVCGIDATNQSFMPISCIDSPDSGSCTSWNPTAQIVLSGGVRHVDATWFDGVISNPAPLWTCDDAYFQGQSTTKFVVQAASSGEMLYTLGLRNGDIPQTLNGMPLKNYLDAADAFLTLYENLGASSYTLVVKRGTNTITLYYVLD